MDIKYFSLSFKNPIFTSSSKIENREGFLIYIKNNGTKGVGEATPLSGWTESFKECRKKLNSIKDISQINEEKSNKFPATFYGIKLALFDSKSRNKGIPLYQYLGREETVEYVKANTTIGNIETDKTVKKAVKKVDEGFECIKLKVGKRSLSYELKRIKSVKDKLPKNIQLRIDVNGGWNKNQAKKAIEELKDTVDYLEQPLSYNDLDGHKNLRNKYIDIGLDESLCTNSIDDIINSNIADTLVLKPMVLGGIKKTRDIALKARNNNISCIITTTFDGAIARSCAVHIAASLKDIGYCGIATGDVFIEDLIPDPAPIKNGKVKVPNSPGNVSEEYYKYIN